MKSIVAAAMLLVAATATAQLPSDMPVTSVNGKDYYYYDVKPRETLFSISRALGISRDEIISSNPQAAETLEAYSRLYFPVDSFTLAEAPATVAEATEADVTHVVRKGETPYGISRKYGITVDRLIELNPTARDGVREGETLVISTSSPAQAPTSQSETTATEKYVIGQGETLYRIAANHDTTVDCLLRLNPGLDTFNYSAGTEILIPSNVEAEMANPVATFENPVDGTAEAAVEVSEPISAAAEQLVTETPAEDVAVADEAAEDVVAEIPVPTHHIHRPALDPMHGITSRDLPPLPNHDTAAPEIQKKDSYTIALLLPLMLNEENPPRSAEMFTDFYRGFLLAADTLSRSGATINIRAYDTAASLDTIKALMDRPEMKDVDIFIGPDNDAQFNALVDAIDEEDAFIINTFAVRNDSYLTHANVIQTNLPHTAMYTRAIDAFIDQYADRTPVIIGRKGGDADKSEFVDQLRARLRDMGRQFHEITYTNALTEGDLESLASDSAYVFVPLSGSRAELQRFTPALKLFKGRLTDDATIAMFGYPEWLTFRGDVYDSLGELNASIYSRFYYDTTTYPARRVAEKFRNIYGRDMVDVVPSQAILGYDTATFAINGLRANGGDFHLGKADSQGYQSAFVFDDSDCDGLVNTSLVLVTFHPAGVVQWRRI